jgi:hypothetical protein
MLLLGLVGVGAGAAIILVPRGELGQEAQIAVLSPADALAQLTALQEPLAPQLAFRQAELVAEAGDAAAADNLLAALAERTLANLPISKARADLALRSGDLQAAVAHLAPVQSATPEDALLRQRLGLLYRRTGETGAERALLSAVTLAELSKPELVRLVDLTAAEGATEQARDIARLAVPLGGQNAPDLVHRFAALALLTGADAALADAAADWLSGPGARALATPLASVLAASPQNAEAIAAAVVTRAPESRALLISALAEAGLYTAARSLLHPWAVTGPKDAESWAALVLYADRSGDVKQLDAALRLQGPPGNLEAGALLVLVRYGGGQALLPHRARLTPDLFAQAPLIAAAWDGWQQRPDAAYAALRRAARSGADPALWRAVANELQGTSHLERLRALARNDPDLGAMFED